MRCTKQLRMQSPPKKPCEGLQPLQSRSAACVLPVQLLSIQDLVVDVPSGWVFCCCLNSLCLNSPLVQELQ